MVKLSEEQSYVRTLAAITSVMLVAFFCLSLGLLHANIRAAQDVRRTLLHNFSNQISKDVHGYRLNGLQQSVEMLLLEDTVLSASIFDENNQKLIFAGVVPEAGDAVAGDTVPVTYQDRRVGTLEVVLKETPLLRTVLIALIASTSAAIASFIAGYIALKIYVRKYIEDPLNYLRQICDETLSSGEHGLLEQELAPQFSLFATSFNDMQARLADVALRQRALISSIEDEKHTFESFLVEGGISFLVFSQNEELEHVRGIDIQQLFPDLTNYRTYSAFLRFVVDKSEHVQSPSKNVTRYIVPVGDEGVVEVVSTIIDGKRFAVKVDDYSVMHSAEKKIAEISKQDALGSMSGGISHDFNNILASILANLELMMLKREVDGDAADVSGEIAACIKCVALGQDLSHRLMTYSRNEPQFVTPHRADELLNEALPLIRSALGAKYRLSVENDYFGVITTDSGLFTSCLINLCLNAQHEMPYGGDIKLGGKITSSKNGIMFEVSVFNPSPPVSNTILRRAFDPFFTTRRAAGGTGLGLAMIMRFCSDSGGTAKLMNVDGGVCAVMLLPVSNVISDAPRDKGASAKATVATPDRIETYRILLIDDNEALGASTKMLLELKGHTVVYQNSFWGDSNDVETFKSFDVIITDNTMPEVTGLDGLRRLREMGCRTRAIVMTGDTNVSLQAPADTDLGVRLLHKPISAAVLLENVCELASQET